MKDGKGALAGIGAMALAVLCCAGLPLIVGASAAVSVGGVLGGVGVAVAIVALIAIAAIAVITWRRQRRI